MGDSANGTDLAHDPLCQSHLLERLSVFNHEGELDAPFDHSRIVLNARLHEVAIGNDDLFALEGT